MLVALLSFGSYRCIERPWGYQQHSLIKVSIGTWIDENRAQTITRIQQGHVRSANATSYYGLKNIKSSWFPSQELGFVAPNSTKEVANKTLVQTFSRLQCRLCDINQNHQIASYFIFGQCILPHFAAKRK